MTVHPNALGTPTSSLNRLTDGRRYPRIKDSPAAVLESCKGYSGAGLATFPRRVAGQPGWGPRFRPRSIVPVPIKPRPQLGVFRFWRLLIFAVEPVRKKPFGGAENSPIAFICEPKK